MGSKNGKDRGEQRRWKELIQSMRLDTSTSSVITCRQPRIRALRHKFGTRALPILARKATAIQRPTDTLIKYKIQRDDGAPIPFPLKPHHRTYRPLKPSQTSEQGKNSPRNYQGHMTRNWAHTVGTKGRSRGFCFDEIFPWQGEAQGSLHIAE